MMITIVVKDVVWVEVAIVNVIMAIIEVVVIPIMLMVALMMIRKLELCEALCCEIVFIVSPQNPGNHSKRTPGPLHLHVLHLQQTRPRALPASCETARKRNHEKQFTGHLCAKGTPRKRET